MSGVNLPQKQQGLAQTALPIAAQAAGSALGPAGAVVGGLIGSKLAGGGDQPQALANGAMQRRLDSTTPMPAQSTHSDDIANAQQALAQMPPDQQKQYAPILTAAQQKLRGGQP